MCGGEGPGSEVGLKFESAVASGSLCGGSAARNGHKDCEHSWSVSTGCTSGSDAYTATEKLSESCTVSEEVVVSGAELCPGACTWSVSTVVGKR